MGNMYGKILFWQSACLKTITHNLQDDEQNAAYC